MNRLSCLSIAVFFFSITTAFSQPLSPNAEQRLLSFCELYSTVKYYYPDPNLQDFPWDAFANQGYSIAKTAENDSVFIRRISNLFRTIAPGVQISKKKFNLARITPEDTLLYLQRAFWQHQGGVDEGKPSRRNGAALNYIYPVSKNRYGIEIYLDSDSEKSGKYNKKTILSWWIKTENMTDSAGFYFTTLASRFSKPPWEDGHFQVKALNNEWKQYFLELAPNDSVRVNQCWFGIEHPLKGTVYVDDLRVEFYNGSFWESISVPNGDFEQYDANGKFRFWTELYSGLAIADSINAVEGKYCLKLPAIREQFLYPPQPVDKPHAMVLPEKYFAYIPLQLYANDSAVFPAIDTVKFNNYKQRIRTRLDSVSAKRLAITWCMQIWAALYQDYPYRDANFKNHLNSLLIETINKLESGEYKDVMNVPYHEFLVWINDPHARIEFEKIPKQIRHKTIIQIPVLNIDLTETQCVIKEIADTSVTMIKRGDIILRIGDIDIDSLLQVYRNRNVSRQLQGAAVYKLLTAVGKSELPMTVKRENEVISLVFTPKTSRGYSYARKILSKMERGQKSKILHDSLKGQGLYYIDCATFSTTNRATISTSDFSFQEEARSKAALYNLVTEINGYDALILDVRERGNLNLLHAFNERYGIDISKKRYVTKTAFAPVAQFRKDTTNRSLEEKRETVITITIPIYVLIDFNTHSAPELALLNLKASGKATFIGSNTSGAAGYQCAVKIADDIFLYYTSGQMVGLDDNPMSYQGSGIAPDIYVYPTPQGIAEGRDEVLEKAIEMALKKE